MDPKPVPLLVIDENDIRFKRLIESGKASQTRASSAVQDNLGFMWFATQYGLARYDGYKMKVFKHQPGLAGSLNCVYVHSVIKDRLGNIWAGCTSVVDRFDPVHETFAHFPLQAAHDVDSAGPVEDMHEDGAGTLWLATKNGLFALNPSSGRIKMYKHRSDQPASISSNSINSVDEDRDGQLWVATRGGLERLDKRSGTITYRIPLGNEDPLGFHEDRFGTFWISRSSPSCPLSTFDRKANSIRCYEIREKSFPHSSTLGLSSMIETKDGTMWFASRGAGLLKFDRSTNTLVRYSSQPQDSESIGSNQVLSLFEDKEGEIWTCMHQVAPNFFSERAPDFRAFTKQRGNLAGDLVTTIFEDRDRTLWIGTTGALNRIDGRDGRNIVPHGSATKGELLSIVEDKSGVLIGGTFRESLQRIDSKTGLYAPYGKQPKDVAAQASFRIMRLLFDRDDVLWAATWGGLRRYDASTGEFATFRPDPSMRVDYSDVKQDSRGGLWLGGESGLQYFDPETKRFKIYRHDPDDPHSLSSDRVNSVILSRSGQLWVGTQDGLDEFERSTGTFRVFATADGLSGNVVSCILEDDGGQLWMGTNNGLSRFDPAAREFTTYSTADGLPGQDLTGWSTCYQSPRGEMYFGGFSGATAFNPASIHDATSPPTTVLTDFRLFESGVPIGNNSPLKESITFTKSLVLTSEQRFFSFEFAALSFYDSSANRYRYRLDGFDRDWHYANSSNRIASYSSLPAGKYVLRVESATSRGLWGGPGVSLALQILPPWWRTWWFTTFYVTGLAFLLWIAYLARLQSITKQYESNLAERLSERSRIARELHDTLLQGFQGLIFQFHLAVKVLPPNEPLSMRMDQILSRADQVMTEGRLSVHELRDETADGLELPDLLLAFGEQLQLDYQDMSFSLSVAGERRAIDSRVCREVYFVGREAISNAFRHSRAKQIHTSVLYGQTEVKLTVQDNGKGMEAQNAKIAPIAHWGFIGMRERASRIGGTFTVESTANSGTTISLIVPTAPMNAKRS